MTYNEIYVLVPGYGLEEFSTDFAGEELSEQDIAGFLNALAVSWHPRLLAETRKVPDWHRSDVPPDFDDHSETDSATDFKKRLIFVPSACDEWLPEEWLEQAKSGGATLITGLQSREELIAAALNCLDQKEDQQKKESETAIATVVDAELVADFLALASCAFQMESLMSRMHHFDDLIEPPFEEQLIEAAEAAVAGEAERCRELLQHCFEHLTTVREQFYPVDCFLIDLCLLIPRIVNEQLTDEWLPQLLAEPVMSNFLISGNDLEQIAEKHPRFVEQLQVAWKKRKTELIGGEWRETASALLPMESVLWNFQRGREGYQRLCGESPKVWGRRRFGLSTNLPQVLQRSGQVAALHWAMDHGIYPDDERGNAIWEGCDGSSIDAMTRLPLSADSWKSALDFMQRIAESMEEDPVAVVAFAHWPNMSLPWFEDLRRSQKYSPCLGCFVTLSDFFENTDGFERVNSYDSGQYSSSYLLNAISLQERDPLSRFRDHLLRRQRFDAAHFFHAMLRIFRQQPLDSWDRISDDIADDGGTESVSSREAVLSREEQLELTDPDAAVGSAELVAKTEQCLSQWESVASGELSEFLLDGAGDSPGFLLLNSLSFSRTVSVELPELLTPPVVGGAVQGVQFDEAHHTVTVTLPPCGFVWIPAAPTDAQQQSSTKSSAKQKSSPSSSQTVLLAEEFHLQNEFFEVWLHPETGGISRIKEHGRKPNRLSQQLAFRFGKTREWTVGTGSSAEQKTADYSEMRCRSSRVICAGPHMGEIETVGELVDPSDGSRLADFQQTVRVWRGRPVVEINITLDTDQPIIGNVWDSYFAARFAWNDSTAALTRSVQQGAQGVQQDRFESLHYLEIASPEERTTILNHGQPYHCKTGERMIDSLLIVAEETQRTFRFTIAIDEQYPLQASLNAMVPPTVVPVKNGPPSFGESGWFFHLDSPNVQLIRLMELIGDDAAEDSTQETASTKNVLNDNGFSVRLLETEGYARTVRIRCFKTPSSARQRDFTGRTVTGLSIEGDCVLIEMTGHGIADVELRF